MDNANSPEYLNKIKNSVIENLSRTKFAPSVQMTDVPGNIEGMDDEADAELDDLDEDENQDTRYTQRRWDKYVEKDGELSDSENEDENQRNGIVNARPGKRRRNMMDYQNANAVPDFESGIDSPAPGSVNGAAEAQVANGAIHNAILRAKASASPAAPPQGTVASQPSLSSNASVRGDVEMADGTGAAPSPAAAVVASVLTPPDSPPVDLPVTAANTSTDITMGEASDETIAATVKDTAVAERQEENTNGEAVTEAVSTRQS